MLLSIPIWHGLRLAQKILRDQMPNAALAKRVIQNYESGLSTFAAAIEARKPEVGSYGDQALQAWRQCIKD